MGMKPIPPRTCHISYSEVGSHQVLNHVHDETDAKARWRGRYYHVTHLRIILIVNRAGEGQRGCLLLPNQTFPARLIAYVSSTPIASRVLCQHDAIDGGRLRKGEERPTINM